MLIFIREQNGERAKPALTYCNETGSIYTNKIAENRWISMKYVENLLAMLKSAVMITVERRCGNPEEKNLRSLL